MRGRSGQPAGIAQRAGPAGSRHRRAVAAAGRAERHRGNRRRLRDGRVRAWHAGPGVPRAGVRPRGSGRRGRRRHLRRDAVAPRRSRAGGTLPRAPGGAGTHPPRRRRRRVRRARGPVDADPLGVARTAREPAGEDGLQPRGVVHRARAPALGSHLGGAPGDARRPPRLCPHEHPARRRRVRLELDRGDGERGGVCVRAVQRSERADRVAVGLHEQPAVRRDARLRRGADLLRRRGADGQARDGARARSGRAPPPERARPRRHPADGPVDHGLAAGCGGDQALRGDAGARPGGAAARRDRPSGRRGQYDARRGRAAGRRLRRRFQEHRLLGGLRRFLRRPGAAVRRRFGRGPLRRGRGGPGRHQRDPPGGVPRAGNGARSARARLDGARRVVGLRLGLADDLDGRGRRARRLPRGACGA